MYSFESNATKAVRILWWFLGEQIFYVFFFFFVTQQVWGLGGKGTSGDTGGIYQVCAWVCECARICLDGDMTSSLDGPFRSVHSCHATTADEEAAPNNHSTARCCCSSCVVAVEVFVIKQYLSPGFQIFRLESPVSHVEGLYSMLLFGAEHMNIYCTCGSWTRWARFA